MQNYFIKHPDGGFCYFNEHTYNLHFLTFLDYLINKNMIQDSSVIETLNKVKSFCKYDKGYKFFYIPIKTYEVDDIKTIQEESPEHSFEQIKASYLKLVEVNHLLNDLSKVMALHEKIISTITNKDFEAYVPIDVKKEYFSKKEKYYTSKAKKEYRGNENNKLTYNEYYKWIENKVQTFLKPLEEGYDTTPVIKTHADYKKPFNVTFDDLVESWQEVLDSNGNPHQIEANSAIEHFQQSKNYAVFCENSNNEQGYCAQGTILLVPINEAQLFISEQDAQEYIDLLNIQGAIVEVDVNFTKIVKTIGKVDLSNLDTVVAHQEKEHIEQMETKESLAQKLLNFMDDDDPMKSQLEQILTKKEVQIAKPRKKI